MEGPKLCKGLIISLVSFGLPVLQSSRVLIFPYYNNTKSFFTSDGGIFHNTK